MTRAAFFIKDGVYTGFEVAGHSGYAEEGSDIVCASVSAMVSLTAAILEKEGVDFTFTSDESAPSVKLEIVSDPGRSKAVSAFAECVRDIAGQYGKYLSATEVRR